MTTSNRFAIRITEPDAKPDRPAWQQALLSVPSQNRYQSQDAAVASISKLESDVSVLCDHGARNALDLSNIVVVKCLYTLIEVIFMNGDQASFTYYLSEKTMQEFDSYMRPFCAKIFSQEDLPLTTEQPEVLVPIWIAAIVASGYYISKHPMYNVRLGGSEIRTTSQSMRDNYFKLLEFVRYKSDEASCDVYLRETLGASFTAEILLDSLFIYGGWIDSTLVSMVLVPSDVQLPSMLAGLKELVSFLQYRTEFLFNSPLPNNLKISTLVPINYQFNTLAWCYRRVCGRHQKKSSDPDLKEWWAVSNIFIKVMKKAIKQSQEQQPFDAYNFVSMNFMLLEAMLTGVSPTVSYSEIQALTNDMAVARVECDDWAPAVWLYEKQTLQKYVHSTVLPFLKRLNPKTYKTASVDVYTPGFLDLYGELSDILSDLPKIPVSKKDTACAFCGVERPGLMRCGACKSVCYCGRECQKKGWKEHKAACKKAQKS